MTSLIDSTDAFSMNFSTQAANKLKGELEQFGTPPKFPDDDPEVKAKMEAEMKAAHV